jgi:hypothetical protein
MGDISASAEAKDKATGKGKSKTADEASFNIGELREIADLVDEHGFTEFEFENENIRVRLSKQVNAPVYAPAPQHFMQQPQAAPSSPAGSTAETLAGRVHC